MSTRPKEIITITDKLDENRKSLPIVKIPPIIGEYLTQRLTIRYHHGAPMGRWRIICLRNGRGFNNLWIPIPSGINEDKIISLLLSKTDWLVVTSVTQALFSFDSIKNKIRNNIIGV